MLCFSHFLAVSLLSGEARYTPNFSASGTIFPCGTLVAVRIVQLCPILEEKLHRTLEQKVIIISYSPILTSSMSNTRGALGGIPEPSGGVAP